MEQIEKIITLPFSHALVPTGSIAELGVFDFVSADLQMFTQRQEPIL